MIEWTETDVAPMLCDQCGEPIEGVGYPVPGSPDLYACSRRHAVLAANFRNIEASNDARFEEDR